MKRRTAKSLPPLHIRSIDWTEVVTCGPSASTCEVCKCRHLGSRFSGGGMEKLRRAASIISPVAQVSPFASKVRALAGSAGTVASRPRSLLPLSWCALPQAPSASRLSQHRRGLLVQDLQERRRDATSPSLPCHSDRDVNGGFRDADGGQRTAARRLLGARRL
jgi:hypothetical protein